MEGTRLSGEADSMSNALGFIHPLAHVQETTTSLSATLAGWVQSNSCHAIGIDSSIDVSLVFSEVGRAELDEA